MSTRISGIIVAFNEESNIRYSLGSLLPWCDEVVVVDQESTDRTVEIARGMGARIVAHPNTGFVEPARQFAIDQTTGDWVVMLDADEMIPSTLAARLRAVAQDDQVDVVRMPRVNIVLGRWARAGRNNWPNRHPRFFRRGAMVISERIHFGFTVPDDARKIDLPVDRDLAIWHFSYESIDDMMEKFNRYTSVQARQGLGAGAGPPRLRTFLTRPLRWLWLNYFRLGGFRDGRPGLVFAISRAFYEFLLVAKTWDEANMADRLLQRDAMRERLMARYAASRDGADEPD